MRSRDSKGRFIKAILKKQKRNKKRKGVEEGRINVDIFKREIYIKKYFKNIYFLIYVMIWNLKILL